MSLFRRDRTDADIESTDGDRPTRVVETRADRLSLARDAGIGDVSSVAVIAGSLVALATTGIVLGLVGVLVGGIAGSTSVARAPGTWGLGAAVVTVVAVWLAFTFGGYTSGRIARRAGATNGFLVSFTALLVALVGLGVFVSQGDAGTVGRWLHNAGVRSTGGWLTVAAVTGIGSAVIMVISSTLGGVMGERWHSDVLDRAASRAGADDDVVDVRDRVEPHSAAAARQLRARDDEVVSDEVSASPNSSSRHDVLPQGRR